VVLGSGLTWGWWFGRVGVGGLVELGLVVWSSWGWWFGRVGVDSLIKLR